MKSLKFTPKSLGRLVWSGVALILVGLAPLQGQAEDPDVMRVCATTPDLADLARKLGGDRVEVFCFSKGPEDPHVIEIRPSLVRQLKEADLFLQVGLGIESAWLGALMNRVKNPDLRPGQPGSLILAAGVRGLGGDEGQSAPGTFHEEGNPHYLLDPVEGLKAAKTICDRFVELRPRSKARFEELHEEFCREWAVVYFGEDAAAKIDLDELTEFPSTERLEAAVREITDRRGDSLGGVAGALRPYAGVTIVGDHDLWPYFARRFQLEILDYLEPSPGVPPTTKHLGDVIRRMKKENVRVILTAPYFPPRHAQFVASRTDAAVVSMAHQTEGRDGAGSYLDLIRFNARQLAEALKTSAP